MEKEEDTEMMQQFVDAYKFKHGVDIGVLIIVLHPLSDRIRVTAIANFTTPDPRVVAKTFAEEMNTEIKGPLH